MTYPAGRRHHCVLGCCCRLKLRAASRSKDGVDVQMLGVEATFEVLNVLEYSSARGRMSVIARAHPCSYSRTWIVLHALEYSSARGRTSIVS